VSLFLLTLGFGLVTAAIIGTSAVALSLQMGVTNVPNFAHGELMTYGAYGAYVAVSVLNWNIAAGVLVGLTVAGIVAWAMNRFVLQSFIRARTPRIYLLVVTAGLSLILQNGLAAGFTGAVLPLAIPNGFYDVHQIGPFTWTTLDITVMVGGAITMVVIFGLLRYTRFGRAQRAVSELPELALVSGVPVSRVVNLTWLITGVLAGLAGLEVAATSGTVSPTLGYTFLLIVFAAVILGGIGKPQGALVAAIIIGIATEVAAAYTAASYKQIIAVAVLILAILFRPNGLFTSAREAQTWTAIHLGTDQ
jgi:branched-subunit amino acid ABC-type transport system permease component